jgi:exodeoxyribonuclease VIII
MQPGIYHDLPIGEYHGDVDSISKSGLDDVARSPAHYYARRLDPRRPPAREKSGQLEGTLAHCATLEPDQFKKRFRVGATVNRNTKIWKEFAEKAQADGFEPIQDCQYDAAMRQADSVRALPEVKDALAAGHAEISACWRDEDTGALCRCRPDWMNPAGSTGCVLIDLKTYSDASAAQFVRQVARKSYAGQAGYYTDGFAQASGRSVLGFVFVAVETEWPHAAACYMLDDESLEAGRRWYRRHLATYAECLRTGAWPGYSPRIELLTLPRWATVQTTTDED